MTTIGRYEILEKIGEGGFGEVYSAMDPSLQRKVAIKTCTSRAPEHLQHFAQEAALAATLSHRNITATYDFFDDGDQAFLVQEYLEGEDLDQKIARQQELSFTTKLGYLIQLARGLCHAHNRRVVHRDVKPSNVRILPNDQVKLMDFGIARSLDDEDHLTSAGETMGTAGYLSPEQVRGERVDERCDIYSFGVTAYELLSYKHPFPGEDTDEVLRAVVSTPPAPIENLWLDCPPSLARMVGKCLEKNREDRYNTFREILGDFDLILGEDSGQLASQDVSDASVGPQGNLASPPETLSSAQAGDDFDHERTVVLNRPTISVGTKALGPIPPHQEPKPAAPVPSSQPLGLQNEGGAPGPSLLKLIAGLAAMAILGALAAIWFFGLETSETSPNPSQTATSPAAGGSAPLIPEDGEEASQDKSATPPPSAVLERATLVLLPAWSPAMTARVGARTLNLEGSQELRLSPGNYTVVFQLQDDPQTEWDESQTERRTIELRAGQSTTVQSRLARPGVVTLRAALGSPQAFIRIAGQPLGWAPIDEHVLQPGTYTVTAGDSTLDSGGLTFPLIIESGMESVITVNLDSLETPSSTSKVWNP